MENSSKPSGNDHLTRVGGLKQMCLSITASSLSCFYTKGGWKLPQFFNVEVLKHVYGKSDDLESLSSYTKLTQVNRLKNKLATEYLQDESSYSLHRNHKVTGNQYCKAKAFFLLQILLAVLLTLEDLLTASNLLITSRYLTPLKYSTASK